MKRRYRVECLTDSEETVFEGDACEVRKFVDGRESQCDVEWFATRSGVLISFATVSGNVWMAEEVKRCR